MFKKLHYFFLGSILITNAVLGQCPSSSFTLPADGCIDESIRPLSTSTSASAYHWDFCSGDLELTPTIENIGTSSFLNRGRSFRIVQTKEENWIGFSIDQASNLLVRFEFGTTLLNTPIINNLGNPSSALARAWDFVIYQESGEWYMLVINSTTNELIRYSFGNDLLNASPTAENLGDFGELNTPNNLTIVNDLGTINAFISNGGNGTISRVLFGNSILNTPTVSSFSIAGINNPRGIDIIKDCNSWIGLVTSYSNNKIYYLDFQNDLTATPTTGEISFFTSYTFPAALSIVHEGGNYYSFIQSAFGDLYKLSFGLSIADFDGTGENLGNFGLSSNFATAWVGDSSDWYGFSIEVANPSTPGQGSLIRYSFPTTCNAIPTISNAQNPNINYIAEGSQQITLTTLDNFENINSITKSITISPSLAPQPASQITGNCLSSPISFDGQQISGDITSWSWDFGDGLGSSNLQTDSYSYATTGEYQVKLSVIDANGCNNFIVDTVQVYNEPVPDFTFSGGTTLCKNNLVTFTNISSGETGEIVTWNWDFNGEGSSSDKEPTFTFLTPGVKNITLTSSLPGCANVIQKTLEIIDAPTTAFSFGNTCNTQATTFTDETTGNNLTSWSWDFGDGTTSIEQSPTHIFEAPGEYDVTLTVTNNTGCFTSMVQTVVNHSIPVVSFTNDLPCSTTPTRFFDQSLVDNTNIVAWDWEFGDGEKSNIQHPEHLYTQTGDFNVKLKAYSQFGCVDSLQIPITVAQGPQVEFEWDKSCEGEATTFTDLTNSFGTNITQWTWIIDGQLFTTQNPSFAFTNAGTYPIQLSVTVDNLCAQSLTQDIIIEVPPTVQFDFNEGCSGNDTEFYDLTDQTNDPIIAREWRVNGSIFSTDTIATTLLEPGTYDITLSVITDAGCEETTTSAITLIGSPKADFSTNTIYGAAPLDIQFTNESTGGSIFNWSFGDLNDSTSDVRNPLFTYTETGIYTVTLRTSSEPNCFEETSQLIEVVAPETKATLVAITPVEDLDKTNFMLTIENNGTTILSSNLNILFRADYGTEVIEPFDGLIYAGKTINYNASFALPANANPANICVELIEINPLDKECILLKEEVLISDPYPNPSSGLISVDVMLETVSTIELRLINRSGQPVIKKSVEGVIGLNAIILDGTTLPQGMYIMEIVAGGKTEILKTSIVR